MKIGIVNDSLMAIEALRRIVSSQPEHQIVWVAHNGAEAVHNCAQLTPDLILMDLMMPVMDGVEATRQIMKVTPCSILVVTATVSGHSAQVFEAMGAGALDAVATPILGRQGDNLSTALLEKINRIGNLLGNGRMRRLTKAGPPAQTKKRPHQDCLVAIGCSTGGPQALVRILSYLPKDFPAALVIIQHMDVKFSAGLVEWLNNQIELPVRMAMENDRPQKGTVLVPTTDGHIVLTARGTLSYTDEPRDNYYHPSVDVFFRSVASHWHGSIIAALLTGMGRDGAEGLLAIREKGGHTIAQDEASSVVYGMPKAAAALGAAKEILPVCHIGPALVDLLAPREGIYEGTQRKSS